MAGVLHCIGETQMGLLAVTGIWEMNEGMEDGRFPPRPLQLLRYLPLAAHCPRKLVEFGTQHVPLFMVSLGVWRLSEAKQPD